jgi:transcriptional regulator with XRE-family HTH domain
VTRISYREHFGAHLRSLRRARGLTQRGLAKRSGLSEDSIRRLEAGAFSASIETLRKLALGLEITLGTLFQSFEAFEVYEQVEPRRVVTDLLRYCNDRELELVLRVVRALLETVRRTHGLDPR